MNCGGASISAIRCASRKTLVGVWCASAAAHLFSCGRSRRCAGASIAGAVPRKRPATALHGPAGIRACSIRPCATACSCMASARSAAACGVPLRASCSVRHCTVSWINSHQAPQSKRPPRWGVAFFFVAPGSDLLSHGLSHTTIGACAFHCRVRDGIGWDHAAISAREAVESAQVCARLAWGWDVTRTDLSPADVPSRNRWSLSVRLLRRRLGVI